MRLTVLPSTCIRNYGLSLDSVFPPSSAFVGVHEHVDLELTNKCRENRRHGGDITHQLSLRSEEGGRLLSSLPTGRPGGGARDTHEE